MESFLISCSQAECSGNGQEDMGVYSSEEQTSQEQIQHCPFYQAQVRVSVLSLSHETPL